MNEGNEAATELLESLEDLESGLLEFERALARDEDARPLVHALFRIAHNLKSSFALQGLSVVSTLFHEVENCLDRIRDGRSTPDPGLVDLLMETIDEGRKSASRRDMGEGSGETLRLALRSYGGDSAKAPPRRTLSGLGPDVAEAMGRVLAPGDSAWVLEKSIGPDLDDRGAEGLPIFDTLTEIAKIVSKEIRRTARGEGILVVIFTTALSESELRLAVFDPLIPLDLGDAAPARKAAKPGDFRFLVADDEVPALDLMRTALEGHGKTECARSAGEALSKFREALATIPYDAVFLDLTLGDTSGIGLLGEMRKAESEAGIPPGRGAHIAVCTSIKDYRTISDAFRSQCDLYILKPLSKSILGDALVKFGLGGAATAASSGKVPLDVPVADRSRGGSEPDPFTAIAELDHAFDATPTLEELCRIAVDRGRRFLDIDRMGIFLHDAANGLMRGTTGTDPRGGTVDQSDYVDRIPDTDLFLRDWSGQKKLLAFVEDKALFYRGKEVGRGWNAVFPLRNGSEILGWLTADNLMTGRPFLPMQRWLFALFGQLVAAHLMRKRSHEELVAAIAQLSEESLRQAAEIKRLRDGAREPRVHKPGPSTSDLHPSLAAAKAVVDLALDPRQPFAEGEIRDHLPEIKFALGSAWSLLENLLDWVQSRLDDIRVLRSRVPVEETIRSALRSVETQAAGKSIAFSTDIAPDHTILSDARVIETILRNFVSNAVKYSPTGSAVSIRATRDMERGASLISVKDKGIGIEAERLAVIFTVSRIGRREGTEGESGSGLGLVFCADLARRIGARIEVDSEPSLGSSFTLVLPEGDGTA